MTSVISRITLAAICVSSLLNASEKPTQVLAKHLYANTQNYTVLHDKQGFSVIEGERVSRISNVDVSKDLRGISKRDLESIFATGKALQVSRIGNGHGITTQSRLNGGGPIAGAIAYWLTKTICYGSMAGAATAATAAALAVAAPTVGAGMVGGAITGAVSSAGPAGMIGGAVSSAVAGNAAVATGVALAASEGAMTATAIGGVIAAVETTSASVSIFFTALPFLP